MRSGKKKNDGKILLPPEYEKILRNQVIDENGPGTILPDFEVFLDFIGAEGTEVTGKNNLLPMKSLAPLNQRLTHPLDLGLKRPVQKSYPHINGLFLLVRASGLTYIGGEGGKRLLVDKALLQAWRELNATERYFNLLETWFIRANPEILGERVGYLSSALYEVVHFFQKIPDEGLKIEGNKGEESHLAYAPGLYNLTLTEMFGFLEIMHGKPQQGKGWRIHSIKRTPFGDALVRLLDRGFLKNREFLTFPDEEPVPGKLQSVVQPFFPEWRNNLPIPETEFQDGTFVFKVSLGRVWRRIAVQGKRELNVLAEGILDAFDFDYDQLYRFTYQNRFGAPTHVNHPLIRPWPMKFG